MPCAVVTGGAVRLGAAIAVGLARAGYDVAITTRSSRDAAEAGAADVRAAGRAAYVHEGDLSDDAGVDDLGRRLAAAHPRVDLLVHNAGVFEKTPFADVTRAAYRRMQAINLEAPFFLTQALLPSLLRAPTPSVVLLADIAAERAIKGYAHYTVSKAGVAMLTKALAVELAPRVRVNAIAPGAVLFPPDFDEGAKQRVVARVPLAREGSADDVAGAVVFLARADYVSGVVLPVDGGRSAVL